MKHTETVNTVYFYYKSASKSIPHTLTILTAQSSHLSYFNTMTDKVHVFVVNVLKADVAYHIFVLLGVQGSCAISRYLLVFR